MMSAQDHAPPVDAADGQHTVTTTPKVTLVLPVLGEGEGVVPVIATLFLTARTPLRILVVHDSDTDPTIAVVQRLQQRFPELRLVRNPAGRGLIPAIRAGMAAADTPYVGVWVSNHVEPFGVLDQMMDCAERGADLVSANRFAVKGRKARGGYIKRGLSMAGNVLLHFIIGMPIADITTSLKVYRRSLLDEIPIETTGGGWAFSTELAIKSAIQGRAMAQVPLEARNITLVRGVSSFRVGAYLPTYIHWLLLGWRNRGVIRRNYRAR